MAETIRISIDTSGDFKAVDQLVTRLNHLRDEIGKMNKGLSIGAKFARDLNKIASASGKTATALTKVGTASAKLSKSTRLAVRDVNGLTSTLKRASTITATLGKSLSQQETFAKRLTVAEKALSTAEATRVKALQAYNNLIKKGGGTAQEIADAKRKLDLATQQSKMVKENVVGMKAELRAVKNAWEMYEKLDKTIQSIEASGKQAPTQLLNQYKALEEELEGMELQLHKVTDAEGRLNKIATNGLTGRITQNQKLAAKLRDAQTLANKTSKEEQANIRALESMKKRSLDMMAKENAAYFAQEKRDAAATAKWLEQVQRNSLAQIARDIENQIRQEEKDRGLAAREEAKRLEYLQKVRLNSAKQEQQAIDKAARAEAQLARQRQRDAQQAARATLQALDSIRRGLSGFSSVLSTMMGHINRFATSLRSTLTSALTAASRGIGTLTTTAGSYMSRLRNYLSQTGSSFLNFGNIVRGSMKQSVSSMQEFYAAGFSLVASGAILNRLGKSIFGGITGMFGDYMDYEKALNRAAIAASTGKGQEGISGETTGPHAEILQDMIFGLQRGMITNRATGEQTAVNQSTFNAKDLAQAMYYYASAIGQPIGRNNMVDLSKTVSTIMTMAQVTQTDVETAMKGVLNVAMEFGIDPRNQQSAKDIQTIAAQMGYLANISSMEVPDIAEAFKMLGPMAHILSDRDTPGAGLNETMALTFFASEMGLRGGNVGRGVNQMLTTLLDPTDKAVGLAANAFAGQGFGEATKENWQKFFFNAEGELKGGITGLFKMLSSLPVEQSAQMLAALFTTNATRSVVAIEQAIKQHGGLEEWLATSGLTTGGAEDWLATAQETYLNTMFGSFDNLKNAWFQVQAAIVDGVKGPLISVFNQLSKVLYAVSDAIEKNPIIVKFVGSILVAIASVATFVGGLLILMGTMLLLARGFAMVGAAAHPFFIFITAIPRLLLILSPLLLAVATASALLYAAWKNNFMGMRDAANNFINGFSFEDTIIPKLMSLMKWVQRFARAFNEFVNGILLGMGPTGNLGALLGSIFGPFLGAAFYDKLLNFSKGLDGIRASFVTFITSLRGGAALFTNIGRAFQGFLEQMFFGFSPQAANTNAQNMIGKVLGIENLSQDLNQAANSIRHFVGLSIGYFLALKDAIFTTKQEMLNINPFGGGIKMDTSIIGNIRRNLENIFSSLSGDRIKGILGNLFQGVAQGFAAAMLGAAHAVEMLTKALSQAGQAGDWISERTNKLLGFSVTLEGVAKTVGTAIGFYLGTRLITALVPGLNLFLQLGTVIGQVGIGIAGTAIQLAFFIAKMVVSTAIIAAQVAAVTALTFARVALFGIDTASMGIKILLNALDAEGVALQLVQIGLNEALAASLAPVIAALALVASISLILIGVGAALFATFTLIAGAMLIHTAATQGLSAAIEGAIQIYNGFMAVMVPVVTAIMAVGKVILNLIEYFGSFLGLGNKFYTIGVLMAASLGLIIIGLVAMLAPLIAVIASFAAWIVELIATNLPIIAVVAAIGLIIYALDQLGVMDVNIYNLGEAFNWLARQMYIVALGAGVAIDAITGLWKDSEKQANKGMGQVQQTFTQQAQEMSRRREESVAYALTPVTSAEDKRYNAKVDTSNELYNTLNQPGMAAFVAQYGRQPTSIGEYNEFVQSPEGTKATRERAVKKFNLEHSYVSTGGSFEDQYANIKGQDPVANLQKRAQEAGEKAGQATAQGVAQGTEDGWQEWIQKAAKAVGLDKIYDQITGPDGILNIDDLTKALSPDNFAKLQSQYSQADLGAIFPGLSEYQKQVTDYAQWQKDVTKYGLQNATEMWRILGKSIPTKPDINDLVNQMSDANDEMDALNAELDKYNSFVGEFQKGIESIDLGTAVAFGFAKTPDMIGKTVADFLVTNAETIMGNMGENSPWANEVEFLMDAAIGGGLSRGIKGVNVHKALEKPLGDISKETGVSMDEMLANIPKYVADDRFMGMAVEGMMKGIGRLPEATRQAMDSAGEDIGKALSWQELAQYAVSQYEAGNEGWTLAGYLSDTWGMSIDEANNYLSSHGIDQEKVKQALFPQGLQDYINSAAGDISVISTKGYAFLTSHLVDENQKLIAVSEREFKALDLATKIGLSNMGYTFVIGGQETAEQARASAQNILDSFREAYGDPANPGKSRFTEIEDLGNGYVRLMDLFTNTTVDVPKLEWNAYKESVQEFKNFNQTVYDEIRAAFGGTDGIYKDIGRAYAAQDYMDIAAAAGTPSAGVVPEQTVKITPIVEPSVLTNVGNQIATGIIGAFSGKISGAIQEELHAASYGPPEQGDGTSHAGQAAPSAPQSVTVSLKLDKTAYDTELSNAIIGIQGFAQTTWATHLDLDKTAYDTNMWTAIQTGIGFQTTTFTTTLDADPTEAVNAVQALTGGEGALHVYETHVFTATLDVVLSDTWYDTFNPVQTALNSYQSPPNYTATLAINDYATPSVDHVLDYLHRIDGYSAVATVTTNNVTTGESIAGHALGGIVKTPFQVLGEHGRELAALPLGTRVFTAGDTQKLFSGIASQQRMAQVDMMIAQGAMSRGITTPSIQSIEHERAGTQMNVYIDNINIAKEVDIDRAVERLDRLTGQKMELVRRGQIPFDGNRTL